MEQLPFVGVVCEKEKNANMRPGQMEESKWYHMLSAKS
jgi:hypothetical protein